MRSFSMLTDTPLCSEQVNQQRADFRYQFPCFPLHQGVLLGIEIMEERLALATDAEVSANLLIRKYFR